MDNGAWYLHNPDSASGVLGGGALCMGGAAAVCGAPDLSPATGRHGRPPHVSATARTCSWLP